MKKRDIWRRLWALSHRLDLLEATINDGEIPERLKSLETVIYGDDYTQPEGGRHVKVVTPP